MQIAKLTIESPSKRRRFAVGDIHGCSKTLQKMVEDVLQLEPDDTLYLLGDYIDRGPDSIGVLDYLLHLKESGFDIRPIRGNHEEMLLDAMADPATRNIWYGNGGWGTLRELGIDSPEGIPQRYLDFISDLPYLLVTNDYVFVHAGLDFQTLDPLKDTPPQFMLWSRGSQVDSAKLGGRTLVTGHTLDPLKDTPPQFMLWSRGSQVDSAKLGGRTLVTGHNVTPLFAIKESLGTHHITLDNGCYDKGEMSCGALVAVDLDTRELLMQENIENRTTV